MQRVFCEQLDELKQVQEIYEGAFPANEKQKFATIVERICTHKEFLYVLKNDDEVVAFALIYSLEITGYLLLDYLAIKDSARNRGLGTKLLVELKNLLLGKNVSLILEVDDPNFGEDKELKNRRLGFYKKNNVKEVSHFNYILPPLSGKHPTFQKLLIIPKKDCFQISNQELLCLIKTMYQEVYNRGEEDQNFTQMHDQIMNHKQPFFVIE